MLATGWYQAMVDHVWPRDGKFGEYWEWAFRIEGEKYPLKAFTSNSVRNEKTQQYLLAVRGYVDPDEEFYPSDLRGSTCTVQVGIVEKNGRQFNTVESVL